MFYVLCSSNDADPSKFWQLGVHNNSPLGWDRRLFLSSTSARRRGGCSGETAGFLHNSRGNSWQLRTPKRQSVWRWYVLPVVHFCLQFGWMSATFCTRVVIGETAANDPVAPKRMQICSDMLHGIAYQGTRHLFEFNYLYFAEVRRYLRQNCIKSWKRWKSAFIPGVC